MTSAFACRLTALALLCVVGGCGQTATVQVLRLNKQLPPRPGHPIVQARSDLTRAAVEMESAYRSLDQQVPGAFSDALRETAVVVEQLQGVRAGVPFSIDRLVDLSISLQRLRGKTSNPEQILNRAAPRGVMTDPEQRRETGGMITAEQKQALEAWHRAERSLASATAAVLQVREQAAYGGFVDGTVFRIDAGSDVWHEIDARDTGVVISEAQLSATGDTAVMFVQVTPTQFVSKGISADPTEVARASLVIINKVLAVVSSYVPALAGLSLPRTPGTGGTGVADAPVQQPEQRDRLVEATVRQLAGLRSDAAFQRLTQQVSQGAVKEEDKAAVLSAVYAIVQSFSVGEQADDGSPGAGTADQEQNRATAPTSSHADAATKPAAPGESSSPTR